MTPGQTCRDAEELHDALLIADCFARFGGRCGAIDKRFASKDCRKLCR